MGFKSYIVKAPLREATAAIPFLIAVLLVHKTNGACGKTKNLTVKNVFFQVSVPPALEQPTYTLQECALRCTQEPVCLTAYFEESSKKCRVFSQPLTVLSATGIPTAAQIRYLVNPVVALRNVNLLPSLITPASGSPLSLVCDVATGSADTFSFLVDGHLMSGPSSSDAATVPPSTGLWTCVAENRFSKVESPGVFIDVQHNSLTNSHGMNFMLAFGPLCSPPIAQTFSDARILIMALGNHASVTINHPRSGTKTKAIQPYTAEELKFPSSNEMVNGDQCSTAPLVAIEGISITSNFPIVVNMYRMRDGESYGTAVFPMHGLSQRYVIPGIPMPQTGVVTDQNYILVVAEKAPTAIEIHLNSMIGCLSSSVTYKAKVFAKGSILKETIGNRDVFYFPVVSCDPTGWVVSANNPVSVFVGTQCAHIPLTASKCDPTFEQVLPVNASGDSFASMFTTNYFSKYLKVFSDAPYQQNAGRFNATSSSFVPLPQNTVPYHNTIDNTGLEALSLRSSAPVFAVLLTPSEDVSGTSKGDVAMMNLLAEKHWPTDCYYVRGDCIDTSPTMATSLIIITRNHHTADINVDGNPLAFFNGPGLGISYGVYRVLRKTTITHVSSLSGKATFFVGVRGQVQASDNAFAFACGAEIRT